MSREPNDLIGKIAFACLIACSVAAIVGGLALGHAQSAIDASMDQQQAVACARAVQMCTAAQDRK